MRQRRCLLCFCGQLQGQSVDTLLLLSLFGFHENRSRSGTKFTKGTLSSILKLVYKFISLEGDDVRRGSCNLKWALPTTLLTYSKEINLYTNFTMDDIITKLLSVKYNRIIFETLQNVVSLNRNNIGRVGYK